jgi:hypothetical protein
MACLVWVTKESDEPIRTEYVTASPDVKQMVSLPRRRSNPEGYATLMRYLGIAQELWDVDEESHAAVSFHWPGMIDYVSTLLAQGKPLPPGVDPTSTYPVYKLGLRPKREMPPASGMADAGKQVEFQDEET